MTLPASGQITLQQIADELTQSIASLQDLSGVTFNESSSNFPDGSAPHKMSEFYSYNHLTSSLTVFYVQTGSGEQYLDNTTACAEGGGGFMTRMYHSDLSNPIPNPTEKVYTDPYCTQEFTSTDATLWYYCKNPDGTTTGAIQIAEDGSGDVVDTAYCG